MIDKDGNIIEDKPSSAHEKIRKGLSKLHPDPDKKRDYVPHQPDGAKTKIRDGLEEWIPSGKDGKPLPKPLTVEERRAAKALGLNPDEIEDKRVVTEDDRS